MPRQKRIEVPGALYHIMSRGLDGHNLFQKDEDRLYFLSLLGKQLEKFECRCYGWALQDNHYHLLIRPRGRDLGLLMRRLNSNYARFFNKKYKRRGYLFQDRYKSIATQEYIYFKELIRYIHLNPIRAGIVKSIEKLDVYQWTSHYDLMNGSRFNWLFTMEILGRFNYKKEDALKQYRRFLKEGINSENEKKDEFYIPYQNKGKNEDIRVIGDPEFVRRALKMDVSYITRRNRLRREGKDLDYLCNKICAYFDVSENKIRKSSRNTNRSNARDTFAYLAKRELVSSLNEISNYLYISPSAVSYAIDRGERIVRERNLISII